MTVLVAGLFAATAACGGKDAASSAGEPSSSAAAPSAVVAPFEEHAIENECVLSAAEISALAGVGLGAGQDTETKRADGSSGRSCKYHLTEGGPLSFTATIKVMRPHEGPVTDAMITRLIKPSTHRVPGVGRAVLIETKSDFPQAWVFTDKLITSVVLVGSNVPTLPTDEQWTIAAQQIVGKLPT
ncbi:hypothetical protein [Nocardia altamirensis]|uniref:hypothetical protein n=1 Tax=Nocardia altamirensis TaxID=472158 RepID=UPI00084038C8|nr:hypothetical protein [Nocardia altamirensis]